jgi:hypothetical protein
MRIHALGILALGVLAMLPARANVGDTMVELRHRYGSAKDMGGQMLFEVRLKDGQIIPARDATDTVTHFSVNVYFDGANSAMEVFTRNTGDPAKAEMTKDDIATILAATSDGLTWVPLVLANGKTTWVRSDKKLVARFDPNKTGKVDDASVLVIMEYTEK